MQVVNATSRLTNVELYEIGRALLKKKTEGVSPRELVIRSEVLKQYKWAAMQIMLLARAIVREKQTLLTLTNKLG